MSELVSAEWVALSTRFTPGWPWPENSFGMDPRFGPDGWCRGCGTPTRDQVGPLVIQGSKFPASPVWMPNWTGDVICMSAEVAEQVINRFEVRTSEVHKPKVGATGVRQLIPAITTDSWYDTRALARAVVRTHSAHEGIRTGSHCEQCSRYKWFGVEEGSLPVRASSLVDDIGDVIASRESFGDGLRSFRHLLFRRALGELLVAAHPRQWSMVDVRVRRE